MRTNGTASTTNVQSTSTHQKDTIKKAPKPHNPQGLGATIFLWRLSGSNRRPLHCQRSALPAELSPLKFGTIESIAEF